MNSVHDFTKFKSQGKKISMLTCYDFTMAKIFAKSKIDALLVGDSVAQIIHGHPNTLKATVSMMELHTAAVFKGAPNLFVIADMPFLSTRKGLKTAMDAAHCLMAAGASAVKIEGCDGHLQLITHLVESGIPVMGHLGLTPQSINTLGGPKVQGRNKTAAEKILNDSRLLEKAGCFSLVLECVPSYLGKEITESLNIPTIGIGAGPDTSGQILVSHDMLGMNNEFSPKFLKKYSDFTQHFSVSIDLYVDDVQKSKFPLKEHSYE